MAVKAKTGEIVVGQGLGSGGRDPNVSGHNDGSFFISWTGPYAVDAEEGPRLYTEIMGQAFNAAGAVGATLIVNTEQRDSQFSSDVTARQDGSYVVSYSTGVEDQLEGTFIGHQIIGADGLKVGDEHYSPDYSYYHEKPDGSAFSDGSYVLVSAEEQNFQGYVYGEAGSLEYTFDYGYRVGGYSSVTQLGDDRYLLVWSGLISNPEDAPYEEDPAYGLFGQVRTRDGAEVSTFALADYSSLGVEYPGSIHSVTKALGGNSFVTAFSLSLENGSGSEVFLVTRDLGGSPTAPHAISLGKAGDQSNPDLAVLSDGRYVVAWQDANASDLGDADGSAIVGQLFDAGGHADGSIFLVNTQTAGSQNGASVAALGTDFVVSWQGPDGIKAQVFSSDYVMLPDTYLLTRAGTQDGSPVRDQALNDGPAPTSFYFDLDQPSGSDFVHCSSNDLIITSKAIPDADSDRLIHGEATDLAGTWRFDLDGFGPGSSSIVISSGEALRFLGTRTATGGDTVYVYRTEATFTQNVIEGTLGNDTLRGTTAKDVFFYDTALGAGLGQDQIKNFANGDRIVTTTQLSDPNDDGRIKLNASDRLDFDTPNADGLSSLKIFNANSKAVSTLILEATVADEGGGYQYFYAAAGDPTLGSMHALGGTAEFLL